MKNYFTLSELCITDTPVPLHVADKLIKHHIWIMNPIREKLGAPITASQKSGYRPHQWEIKRGRSGDSQHTFGEHPLHPKLTYLGAIDWTTTDLSKLDELQALIEQHTPYTRIARYKSFIHCDYKPTDSGKREVFTSNAQSNWTFERFLD